MELAAVLFIMIGIVVAVVAVVVLVPLLFGLMAYDLHEARKNAPEKAPATEPEVSSSIALKRGLARSFVILGSAFWSVATFVEMYTARAAGTGPSMLAAIVPLAASLVTLVLGWYWERFTAGALLAATLGVAAWGIVYGFSLEVWVILTITLLVPMLVSAILFWQARREQEAYEQMALVRPNLAFAFAARSSLS